MSKATQKLRAVRPTRAEHDDILDRFESAFRLGNRPSIRDYLPESESMRRPLFMELVLTDLELRLEAGEPARVEHYLERFPEITEDVTFFIDLIETEYDLRYKKE